MPWRRKKSRQPKPPGKIRAALGQGLLKIPFFRRLYLKRLLQYLEETKPHEVRPELRALHTAIQRVPRSKRLETLESAMKQSQEPPPNRQLRRMSEKQSRKMQR